MVVLPLIFPGPAHYLQDAITTVTIGSDSFTGGPHIIVATASNPNGGADADPANNTFTKNIIVCSPLTGAYTINQGVATGGTNFNSFTDFSTYLSNCGVSGNVTATVTAGSGALHRAGCVCQHPRYWCCGNGNHPGQWGNHYF